MPGYPAKKETNMKETRNNRRQTYGLILMIAAIVVVVIIIALLLRGCENRNKEPAATSTLQISSGIAYDSGAVAGGWDEADMDAIVRGLNAKVEEGMINISMNTSPYFENGSAPGNLMIVNEGVNRYPQVVEIVRNDTNETIYKSGAIPVGSKIESAKLNTVLSAGTYACTAMFYNVDPATGDYLGCAGAVITITVLA